MAGLDRERGSAGRRLGGGQPGVPGAETPDPVRPTNNDSTGDALQAKARLVCGGHLGPDLASLRTDAPTVDNIGMVLLRAASYNWRIQSGDVSTLHSSRGWRAGAGSTCVLPAKDSRKWGQDSFWRPGRESLNWPTRRDSGGGGRSLPSSGTASPTICPVFFCIWATRAVSSLQGILAPTWATSSRPEMTSASKL